MKTKLGIVAALLLAGMAVPAFAVESVFQIDVADYALDKDYKVCASSEGYEALASECMNFKGSEFGAYYAEFYFEDVLIGDPFYVSVEDLSTNLFVYKHFENTKVNPQIIYVSMANPGPKQAQATEYDVETETVTQTGTTTWTDPKTGLVYDIPTQGDYCLDFDEDSVCDIDFTDGKQVVYEDEEVIEPEARESGNNDNDDNDNRDDPDCWYGDLYICDENGECDTDRIDCTTECEDGSNVTTGEECPGNDDSDRPADEEGNSDSEGREEVEEEDQSCGGESCTDDEKEDSTTDEDVEENE